MADYKELLRRAVDALPENNGAARRAVYEKARAALVGQLRAINPPLPARDITTHRLQLEDCIRQVEQEASDAVIAGMTAGHEAPVYIEARAPAPKPQPQPDPPQAEAEAPRQAPARPVLVGRETPRPLPAGGSIEDIILAANKDGEGGKPRAAGTAVARPMPMRLASPPPPPVDAPAADDDTLDEPAPQPQEEQPAGGRPNGRALPSIVARAEAAKGRAAATAFGVPHEKPYDAPRRGPTLEPRRDGPRLEPAARVGQAAAARLAVEPEIEDAPQLAVSAVREVEVEAATVDPQVSIDRAIATLDREARGESVPADTGFDVEMDDAVEPPPPVRRGKAAAVDPVPDEEHPRDPAPQRRGRRERRAKPEREPRRGRGRRETQAEGGFPRARPEPERGGFGAITIFLVVFAVLLAGAGGAGYWAVTQGYVDLESMFSAQPASPPAETPPAAPATNELVAEPATGPGNTATPTPEPVAPTELRAEERLTPEPALTGTEPLALAPVTTPVEPAEERLAADSDPAPGSAEAAVAAVDPANIAGSQSLLLEASDDGKTGAVPFSGTVDWSKGTDETGLPTLVGKASIPARNLGVDVLIRKNSDPSLPASHLMEINFRVSDSFIGGSVAGLPGVLLKNEELVQGAPLIGASARVVGNSFLFALSAAPEDTSANNALLTTRKWMDLAIIYATGKRAIITLEKDADAEAMFREVFENWAQTASAAAQ